MRAFSPVARHALAPHRLESRELDFDPVFAWRQAGRRVDAFLARHDDPLQVGPHAVTVMVAPGTAAPPWSLTTPVISPAAIWARAVQPRRRKHNTWRGRLRACDVDSCAQCKIL